MCVPSLQHHYQFHVFQRTQYRHQIVGLEDKPHFHEPEMRQLVLAHAGNIGTIQQYFAGAGRIKAADNIEQGGFAGTGWPYQGGKLALFHFETDIVQRVNLDLALDIGFADIV